MIKWIVIVIIIAGALGVWTYQDGKVTGVCLKIFLLLFNNIFKVKL